MQENQANQNDKLDDALNDLLASKVKKAEYPTANIVYSSTTHDLTIDNQPYKLLENHREGFDIEALKQRYTSFFKRYDFIVGDWAADKLRLKGFYQLNPQKRGQFKQIDQLNDYLNEYINYGAPYFLIAKETAVQNYELLYQKHQSADFKLEPLPTKKEKEVHTKTNRRRKQSQSKRKKQKQHTTNLKHEWNMTSRKKKERSKSSATSFKSKSISKKQPFVIRKSRKGQSKD